MDKSKRDDPATQERFLEIQNAYEILNKIHKNRAKREERDAEKKGKREKKASRGGDGGGSRGGQRREADDDEL